MHSQARQSCTALPVRPGKLRSPIGIRRPPSERAVACDTTVNVKIQRATCLATCVYSCVRFTQNTITFRQRRFRYRSKRRCKALIELQTVHECLSNDMQRTIDKASVEHDAMHATGHQPARQPGTTAPPGSTTWKQERGGIYVYHLLLYVFLYRCKS